VTIRIGAPRGDTSVVPRDRRYLLQVRVDRTTEVRVDGARAEWWTDGHGFTWVRLPAQPRAEVTLTT